jgi:hypothetical protein
MYLTGAVIKVSGPFPHRFNQNRRVESDLSNLRSGRVWRPGKLVAFLTLQSLKARNRLKID